jgi:hypothetical protein
MPHAEPGLTFVRGGFETPLPGGRRPVLIRAFNVLRQYEEEAVGAAWSAMCSRLAPGGLLVEGTCDELGRTSAWVAVDSGACPRTLTLSVRLRGFDRPTDIAERLPKALIHRNIPGEPVHTFLRDFDRAWAACSPLGAFGARQRWIASVRTLASTWPVVDGPGRWRLGEVTVDWAAVAPR